MTGQKRSRDSRRNRSLLQIPEGSRLRQIMSGFDMMFRLGGQGRLRPDHRKLWRGRLLRGQTPASVADDVLTEGEGTRLLYTPILTCSPESGGRRRHASSGAPFSASPRRDHVRAICGQLSNTAS